MEDPFTTIYVDPLGNLTLLASYEEEQTKVTITKTFVVSTKALCLASPVWDAMLNPDGPWAKSASGQEGFRMLDDDPEALLILLDAAHLNFDRIPGAVSSAQLLQLAILCDKYDAVKLVRPWVTGWIRDLQSEWMFQSPGNEHWLFISWAFGDESIYSKLSKYIAISSSVDGEGRCLNQKGNLVDGHLPPGAIESILEARRATIEGLLNLCRKQVDLYIQQPRVCQGHEGPITSGCSSEIPIYAQECDALVLGSLMRGLRKIGLWPIPISKDVKMSVLTLGEKLRAMTCHRKMVAGCYTQAALPAGLFGSLPFPQSSSTPNFGGSTLFSSSQATSAFGRSPPSEGAAVASQKPRVSPTIMDGQAHKQCEFTTTFRVDVQRVLDNMQTGVLDCHREHLAEQERKRMAVLVRD